MSFSHSDEFDVAVPASAAFEHIAIGFFENHPRWDPMVTRMEKTSPGPVGVATTGREWRKVGLRTAPNDVQVVAFQPDTTFGFEATSGPLRERMVTTISPSPAGSRIRVDLAFTPATRSMRLFEPLLRRVVLHNVRKNMVRFRAAVAQGTP